MDDAILAAGWAVLGEVGYGGLTFEAVAARAGCNRPALYRRYGSRRELVLGLVLDLVRQLEPPPPADGDPRRVLIDNLKGFVVFLQGQGGAAMLGLSQARRDDPELDHALNRMFEDGRAVYARALTEVAGGAAPPPALLLVIDALLGAVVFRVLLRREVMPDAEVERLADILIGSVKATAA